MVLTFRKVPLPYIGAGGALLIVDIGDAGQEARYRGGVYVPLCSTGAKEKRKLLAMMLRELDAKLRGEPGAIDLRPGAVPQLIAA